MRSAPAITDLIHTLTGGSKEHGTLGALRLWNAPDRPSSPVGLELRLPNCLHHHVFYRPLHGRLNSSDADR